VSPSDILVVSGTLSESATAAVSNAVSDINPLANPDTVSPSDAPVDSGTLSESATAAVSNAVSDSNPLADPATVPPSSTLVESDTLAESATAAVSSAVPDINPLADPDTVPPSGTLDDSDTLAESGSPARPIGAAPSFRPHRPERLVNKISRPQARRAARDVHIADILARNGNQRISLRSGFTPVLWAVDDILAPIQTPAEQVVYRQLYRLSYGFGNTHCFIGYDALSRRCNISVTTLKKAIEGLADSGKRHIPVLETVNTRTHRGTVYQVFLPDDIETLGLLFPDLDTPPAQQTPTDSDTLPDTDTDPDFGAAPDSATAPESGAAADSATATETTRPTLSETDRVSISTRSTPSSSTDLLPTHVRTPRDVRHGGGRQPVLAETPKVQPATDGDNTYIYGLGLPERAELRGAQSAWLRWFPELPAPRPEVLGDLLTLIRSADRQGGQALKFLDHALKRTKERKPKNVAKWLNAGLKQGFLIDDLLALQTDGPATAAEDAEFIDCLSRDDRFDILESKFAWAKWFPKVPTPKDEKLHELLGAIRARHIKGTHLQQIFEHALKRTLERQPDDMVGRLTHGLRQGFLIDPEILST
jgi:hypothetical protein